MWWRVDRAARKVAAGEPIVAAGILHSYDPVVLGSAIAASMGAAVIGGGGAAAQDGSGRWVSATGLATQRITSWAARDSRRYARLPHSLMAVVTPAQVCLCRWSPVAAMGPPIVWPAGSFAAMLVRHKLGGLEAEIVLRDGKRAVLSALSGPCHRGSRRTILAITAPNPETATG